jgi:hypothetical protein
MIRRRFRDSFDTARLCPKPRYCTGEIKKCQVFRSISPESPFVLIIPWSCVRITPGLLRFGSVNSCADRASGGAASAPLEVALLAKPLANGPANTRCRASNAAHGKPPRRRQLDRGRDQVVLQAGFFVGRPARSGRPERRARGCHCGRQDRRVTPVGLRSVPFCGSDGGVFAGGSGRRESAENGASGIRLAVKTQRGAGP